MVTAGLITRLLAIKVEIWRYLKDEIILVGDHKELSQININVEMKSTYFYWCIFNSFAF